MAYIDQGEFEAMKMLSGHRAPHCDKHQFRVSEYLNRLRDIVVERLKVEQRRI